MRYIFGFLFTLSFFVTYSQEDEVFLIPPTEEEEPLIIYGTSNHQIGINLSADVAYRILSGKGDFDKDWKKWREDNEMPVTALSLGIGYIYHFNNLLSIETGLGYSQKGFQNKNPVFTYETFDKEFDTIMPYADYQIAHRFHYIDIPLKLNFTFGFENSNIRMTSGIGVVGSVLMASNSSERIILADGEVEKNKGIPVHDKYVGFNISPIVSVGLEVRFSDRMLFKVEPVAKFGILPIANNAKDNLYERLFSVGLNGGLYWNL